MEPGNRNPAVARRSPRARSPLWRANRLAWILCRSCECAAPSWRARWHDRRGAEDEADGRRRERHSRQDFTAFSGRLVGRPDVIRVNEVVDYKSGAILEHDAATLTDVVKAAYVRQLRIYGYLVKQNLGWWPERGVLLPLGGPGVEVGLEPSECEQEASEAVALLDAYNNKVQRSAAPNELASASPQSCRWCAYKLLAQPFGRSHRPSGPDSSTARRWKVPSLTHRLSFTAARRDRPRHAGRERRAAHVQISPLSPTTHPTVMTLLAGERVRLVGLRARPDGILMPTQRTVLAKVGDLPPVTPATGQMVEPVRLDPTG